VFISTTQIAQAAGVSPRTILVRTEQRGAKPFGLFESTKLWTIEAAETLRKADQRPQ